MSPQDLARGVADKVVDWLGRRESGTVVSVSMLMAVCYGIFWAAPQLIQQHVTVVEMIRQHDANERESDRKHHLQHITLINDNFTEITRAMREERMELVGQLRRE